MRLSEFYFERYGRVVHMLGQVVSGGAVDLDRFDAFRRELAQQLAVEERVLMPALAAKLGASFEASRRELKRRHTSVVTLLVPTPCHEWVVDLRDLLRHHLAVEFGPAGLYEQLDAHLSSEAAQLLARGAALEPVVVEPFQDGLEVRAPLDALLAKVGVSNES